MENIVQPIKFHLGFPVNSFIILNDEFKKKVFLRFMLINE